MLLRNSRHTIEKKRSIKFINVQILTQDYNTNLFALIISVVVFILFFFLPSLSRDEMITQDIFILTYFISSSVLPSWKVAQSSNFCSEKQIYFAEK